ncbi:MAG: DUF4150 domain-containing protein [Sandaracinaceae bacterium]|nr:DUF4150 domain-containing protein [Sandaracinaceae bacterium]
MLKHVADAESTFKVVNVNPDFCKVGQTIVPFDISQLLPKELAGYSQDVHARKVRVLKKGSIVAGVIGNAGAGVMSGVAEGAGHTVMIEGEPTVLVNGAPIVRHEHLCLMNVSLG